MKVAIVHDYLNQYGGAEKVIETLHEIYPNAPIYTSIFQPKNLPTAFSTFDVRPSFMQNLPFIGRHFKKYLLFFPSAIESFDLSGYDIVLSSSSAFAKGARVPDNVCHICYCYSPMRFVWDTESYLSRDNINPLYSLILPWTLARLKRWDVKTMKRVDYFVGISDHIRKRIQSVYHRDADVIYPPVDLTSFYISEKHEDYFLALSRLNAYKSIDLVIEAFNRLSLPLVIIGTGPYLETLKNSSKSNVRFLGRVSQEEVASYLSKCRGFIFPGIEDFGIAPVEAMASGRPVIAYAGGGALETVVEGISGLFFKEQTTDSLVEAIEKFTAIEFDSKIIRRHTEQFDKEIFKIKISAYVSEKISEFKEKHSTQVSNQV